MKKLLRWIIRRRLFNAFLSEYRWYRRSHGGHWEQWYVEPCSDFLWLSVDECVRTGVQRPGGCRGIPECEDWP